MNTESGESSQSSRVAIGSPCRTCCDPNSPSR
ncbi:unnamed protein product [Brugia timori]|uniref:Uncharacterized protein n=1 Tax=Brugia timori TaxID=42155 RepID=A0A0R3QUC0_9BILA|nr:unnamed protein product [Brugia timori]